MYFRLITWSLDAGVVYNFQVTPEGSELPELALQLEKHVDYNIGEMEVSKASAAPSHYPSWQ